ncbi:MAG: Spo0B domain-containing protein [Peptococcaceae bacterium]|nr:Spo0B domain-containing protein [Peptococcaceae bacterium]
MSIQDILELIARKNHDFLNHLQVISGFLQLNKEDKAREYIREMGLEVERMARVLNSRPPEVAAALLTVMNRAGAEEVAIELPAALDLTGVAIPALPLGRLLEDLAECPLSQGCSSRTVSFVLQEQDRRLFLRMAFHQSQSASRFLEQGVAAADALLAGYGGRARLLFEGGRVEIVLTMPRLEGRED